MTDRQPENRQRARQTDGKKNTNRKNRQTTAHRIGHKDRHTCFVLFFLLFVNFFFFFFFLGGGVVLFCFCWFFLFFFFFFFFFQPGGIFFFWRWREKQIKKKQKVLVLIKKLRFVPDRVIEKDNLSAFLSPQCFVPSCFMFLKSLKSLDLIRCFGLFVFS